MTACQTRVLQTKGTVVFVISAFQAEITGERKSIGVNENKITTAKRFRRFYKQRKTSDL